MPLYVYRCRQCNQELEARQSFDDDPLVICEACGAHKLKRVILSTPIQFKGDGFYINGDKNDNNKRNATTI